MKIIVDAMGGDFAPLAPVKGALLAHERYGTEIILTGRTEDILRSVRECGREELPAGVEIVNAEQVVEICDDPSTAFKQKKDSSLTVGLNLLRDGQADGFVCAGSTGALLAGATLVVKRIRGLRRAALSPTIPTATGKAVLIDCGANAECTVEYLLQFAYLGSYYAEKVLGVERPRVGLLNIGAEESKITELARCITARQDSGIGNRRGEHSGVLEKAGDGPCAFLNPERETVRQQGRRMKAPEEPMFTLTTQDLHGIAEHDRIRKLRPIECWRLQGFTDEQFHKAQSAGLSDARLYKMAGNAVTVNVARAIGERLKEIEDEEAENEFSY